MYLSGSFQALWTGLNHMNGRVEDAVTGRFLSPDPVIPDIGNTQDYNRYSYVNNNPLTLIDPSGFDDSGFCDDAGCFNLYTPSLMPPPVPVQAGTYTSYGRVGTITIEPLESYLPQLVSPDIDFDSLNAELAAHPGYSNYLQTQYPSSLSGTGALNGLSVNGGDEASLLLHGYFERPTAAAMPSGGFILNGPAERFYAGLDPAGTAGLRQVQIDLAIMAIGMLAGPEGELGGAEVLATERGVATILDHGGRHVSIIVKLGDEMLHTHQVVLPGKLTTIQEVGQAAPVARSVTMELPNARAALQYQRSVLGQPTGRYNALMNSCVTHCGDVLRSGGVQGVPSGTLNIKNWLESIE
jgi:RHS repeat-associated protein